MTNIHFLRHVVSQDKIQVDLQKVEVVAKWSRPTIVIEIQSFLGLVGYYHCFMKDFLKIVTPLTKLAHKGVKFVWNEDCEVSFQKLKECLISAPMLALTSGA